MDKMPLCTTRTGPDLFGTPVRTRTKPLPSRRRPPELKIADALCRQLRRQSARHEKQRIAHLICLNLVSMLKHRTR